MTTNVLVAHMGPKHNKIKVTRYDPITGEDYQSTILEIGEHTGHEYNWSIYDNSAIRIEEVPEE